MIMMNEKMMMIIIIGMNTYGNQDEKRDGDNDNGKDNYDYENNEENEICPQRIRIYLISHDVKNKVLNYSSEFYRESMLQQRYESHYKYFVIKDLTANISTRKKNNRKKGKCCIFNSIILRW